MKQTAVEWLQEALSIHLTFEQQMQFEGLFQQAKEMEKEQIIDAAYYTCSSMTHYDLPCGEQYYKKEYGR
jgi:hypothetical protein